MARSYTSKDLPAHWNMETRNPRFDSVAWFEGRKRKKKPTELETEMMADLGLKEVAPFKAPFIRKPK